MIQIIAVRHAKPLTEGYAEDALKPLSEEGKKMQKIVIQKLKKKGIQPTLILSSPLLRAKETAEIFSKYFSINSSTTEALGIDFDSYKLLSADFSGTVVLIGHAPTLANFVNALTGENSLPEGLSKSEAAIVSFDKVVAFGEGKLEDVVSPR